MKSIRAWAFLLLAVMAAAAPAESGAQRSGATKSGAVPPWEIREGGPPKEGIPALVEPLFVPASAAARFLRPKDRVIGLEIAGDARAYPIRILNWHELVNDRIAHRPVLVSW